MGYQQERACQRCPDGGQHQRPRSCFAGQRKPGDDNGRRQELQHRRGRGVRFLDGHQEGVLHGQRATQREEQQAEGIFAVLQDAENFVAVHKGEHQENQASEQQTRHGQKRR